jgi:Zn-dependent M28 family amino/carboxypeptidase
METSVLPDDVVGDAYTSTGAWDVLERLVDVGDRLGGSEGERRGAEIVAESFEANGLRDADVTGFEIPGWTRGSSSLTTEAPVERAFGAPHEVVALPGTPAETVEAEVVDLGYALPPDFDAHDVEGKLVLATASAGDPPGYHRPLHRTEKYQRAADAGAAGLVFYSGLEGCLPPTGWAVLERPESTPGPIPAVGASHEVAQRLLRWDERGDVRATLSVDCENAPATSHTAEAVVGPDTDREVLVTAHVDAHDLADGARDNGAGSALVAEVGRLLTRVEGDLDCAVRCVAFGSEEVGFNGAHHWAATHDLDDVKCVLNLDGIGGSRTLRAETHGFDPLGDVFDSVGAAFDAPVHVAEGASVFADQWAFVQRGVPGAAVRSVSGQQDRRWGLGRLWSHTHGDTLDKLDPRDLRALAAQVTEAVVRAAADDLAIPHASPEAVRAAVPADAEEEMRYTGRWPWADGE